MMRSVSLVFVCWSNKFRLIYSVVSNRYEGKRSILFVRSLFIVKWEKEPRSPLGSEVIPQAAERFDITEEPGLWNNDLLHKLRKLLVVGPESAKVRGGLSDRQSRHSLSNSLNHGALVQ